jgi:hypothetical protein
MTHNAQCKARHTAKMPRLFGEQSEEASILHELGVIHVLPLLHGLADHLQQRTLQQSGNLLTPTCK